MKEEEILLASVREHTALMGAAELAKGVEYTDPIKYGIIGCEKIMGGIKRLCSQMLKKIN